MPGERITLRVHSRVVGGAFTIIEVDVPPRIGLPRHYHKYREEIFEVHDGQFRFLGGDDIVEMPIGTSLIVPHGVEHHLGQCGTRAQAE